MTFSFTIGTWIVPVIATVLIYVGAYFYKGSEQNGFFQMFDFIDVLIKVVIATLLVGGVWLLYAIS